MKILKKFNLDYIQKSFFFGLIFNSGNVFSFFFQILLVTFFTQTVITEFSSISSYITILLSTIAYLPMSISAFILNNKNNKNYLKEIRKNILNIMLFLMMVILVLHFPIKKILKIDYSLTLFSAYIFVPMTLLFYFPLGIFNTYQKYNLFAIAQITPLFLRLIFLIFLLLLGLTDRTSLIFICVFLSYLISYLLYNLKANSLIITTQDLTENINDSRNSFFLNVMTLSLASIVINSLLSFDFIYIKNIFNIVEASTYIKIITFAKIPFFLLSVLVYILLPESVKSSKKDSFKLFGYNVFISIFFILVYVPFLYFASDLLFINYSELFLSHKDLFLIGSTNYCILSIISFQIIFIISLKKYKYLLAFFIPIAVFNFLLFHIETISIFLFSKIIFISFTVYLFVNFVFIFIEYISLNKKKYI